MNAQEVEARGISAQNVQRESLGIKPLYRKLSREEGVCLGG